MQSPAKSLQHGAEWRRDEVSARGTPLFTILFFAMGLHVFHFEKRNLLNLAVKIEIQKINIIVQLLTRILCSTDLTKRRYCSQQEKTGSQYLRLALPHSNVFQTEPCFTAATTPCDKREKTMEPDRNARLHDNSVESDRSSSRQVATSEEVGRIAR